MEGDSWGTHELGVWGVEFWGSGGCTWPLSYTQRVHVPKSGVVAHTRNSSSQCGPWSKLPISPLESLYIPLIKSLDQGSCRNIESSVFWHLDPNLDTNSM